MNIYASHIEQADGVEKIDNLQHHHNQDIYEKAFKILGTYFNGEEDVQDTGMEGDTYTFGAPNSTNTTQGFSF